MTVTVPVGYATLVLGGEIEVPSLDGMMKVTVPPSTLSGAKLRMKGKGLPDVNTQIRGDLIAILEIDVTRSSSPEELKIISALAAHEKSHPSKKVSEFQSQCKQFAK